MVKKRRLRVSSANGRHFVQVPSNDANRLLVFLRSNGLPASPPGPCDMESETIDLGSRVDVKSIQALLNKWA